jgi:hypothetical protein
MIGLLLVACGFSPDNIIDPGWAVAEPLRNDGSAQALHLMKMQDPFNCILV